MNYNNMSPAYDDNDTPDGVSVSEDVGDSPFFRHVPDIRRFRTAKEIAEVTVEDLMEMVWESTRSYGLSEAEAFTVYKALSTDPDSPLSRVFSNALKENRVDNSVRSRVSFDVREHLSSDDKFFLETQYPEVAFRFMDAYDKNNHEHVVAAVARRLDLVLMKEKMPMTCEVIDIGGNITHHLSSGNVTVHCCSPVIDLYDSDRYARRHHFVASEIAVIEKRHTAMRKYGKNINQKEISKLKRLKRFRSCPSEFECNSKAEDCSHEALYAMSVHAAYDIPITNWPKIMVKHKTQFVYGSIIINSDILQLEIGEEVHLPEFKMRAVREDVSGEDIIYFYFENSCVARYAHKYTDYIKYANTCTLKYMGITFLYKVVTVRKFTRDFEITILGDGDVKPLVPVVYEPDARYGLVRLRSLMYTGYGSEKNLNNYVPVQADVHETVWSRIMAFCQEKDESLSFDDVKAFVTSLSQVIILNQVMLSDGSTVTADNASLLATVAFFVSIRMRTEAQMQLNVFKDKEKNFRDVANPSFIRNIMKPVEMLASIPGRLFGDFCRSTVGEWRDQIVANLRQEKNYSVPSFLSFCDYQVYDWCDHTLDDYEVLPDDVNGVMSDMDYFRRRKLFEDMLLPVLDDIDEDPYLCEIAEAKIKLSKNNAPLEAFEELRAVYADYMLNSRLQVNPEAGADVNDTAEIRDEGRHILKTSEDDDPEDLRYLTSVVEQRGERNNAEMSIAVDNFDQVRDLIAIEGGVPREKGMVKPAAYEASFFSGKYETPCVARNITPLKDDMRFSYEEPVSSSDDSVRSEAIASMIEFSKISKRTDVNVQDYTAGIVHSACTWTRTITTEYGACWQPKILPLSARMYGQAYAPNLLRFKNGTCVKIDIDYSKHGVIAPTSWMVGMDVTTPSDYRKSKFLAIQLENRGDRNLLTIGDTRERLIFVHKDLHIVLGVHFERVMSKILQGTVFNVVPRITMLEMKAGSGKTFSFCWAARKGDLLLTARKETIGEMYEKIVSRGISPEDVTIRTVDSYLLNSETEHERVFIDEANMMHTGVINGAICKSKARRVILGGDRYQIGYVNRGVLATVNYGNISDTVERYHSNMTYRMPADATLLSRKYYQQEVFTYNQVLRSFSLEMMGENNYKAVPYDKDTHYICFTNNEVNSLLSSFSDRGHKINVETSISVVSVVKGKAFIKPVKAVKPVVTTAHVAEGGTWRNVVIVRASKAELPLYKKECQLLVAVSRHTHSCRYFSCVENDDLWKAISQAKSATDERLRECVSQEKRGKIYEVDGVKYHSSIDEHPVFKHEKR